MPSDPPPGLRRSIPRREPLASRLASASPRRPQGERCPAGPHSPAEPGRTTHHQAQASRQSPLPDQICVEPCEPPACQSLESAPSSPPRQFERGAGVERLSGPAHAFTDAEATEMPVILDLVLVVPVAAQLSQNPGDWGMPAASPPVPERYPPAYDGPRSAQSHIEQQASAEGLPVSVLPVKQSWKPRTPQGPARSSVAPRS